MHVLRADQQLSCGIKYKIGGAAMKRDGSMIKECNISNYSIYNFGELLFSYYEYTGDDYKADMDKMAADPKTQEWWDLVMPFQQPLEERKEGEWWAEMEEVYHLD